MIGVNQIIGPILFKRALGAVGELDPVASVPTT
jgi:hypothetical protein